MMGNTRLLRIERTLELKRPSSKHSRLGACYCFTSPMLFIAGDWKVRQGNKEGVLQGPRDVAGAAVLSTRAGLKSGCRSGCIGSGASRTGLTGPTRSSILKRSEQLMVAAHGGEPLGLTTAARGAVYVRAGGNMRPGGTPNGMPRHAG
jgi:hypothetical protein